MITNRQLISDALAMLGILAETETASAEQATQGLRFLNSLMSEMEQTDGIDLEYYSQTVLADDCPIPAYAEQIVTALLAIRLAAVYPGADPSIAAGIAADGRAKLLRIALVDGMREADMTHLPRGADRSHDITTG